MRKGGTKVAQEVAQAKNSGVFKRAKENPHPAEDRMGADF